MSQKEVLDYIKDIQYSSYKPKGQQTLGRYVFYKPPRGQTPCGKFNVLRYDGDHELDASLVSGDNDDVESDDLVDEGGGGYLGIPNKAAEEAGNNESGDTIIPNDTSSSIRWKKGVRGRLGAYETELLFPATLTKYLIGQGGESKRTIERTFRGLQMTIQKRSSLAAQQKEVLDGPVLPPPDAKVLMEHENRDTLIKARNHVRDLLRQFRCKLPYTHFVSLPILLSANTEVPERFMQFKSAVLNRPSRAQEMIDERIFMQKGQLHFTLFMLKLYDPEDLEKAKQALNRTAKHPRVKILFNDEIPKDIPAAVEKLPPGLHVPLKGIKIMEDDPRSASILYTTYSSITERKDHEWIRLRRCASTYLTALVEVLYEELSRVGLIDDSYLEREHLMGSDGRLEAKFHVTLMNAKLRRGDKISFDASSLVREFENHNFGLAILNGLHLSLRGAAAADTAYYVAYHVIPIRPNIGL